ncbi:hypothetical protein Pedsa_0479 [Pseudopedobacter saltans DSM 12145]|uniref:DUF5703 domain-containing protein n=1 Tax=Pseudopedobacter saltans (strain ATCC 51119 / DSM 12145 / JCM 21818 / CCUG 39354 / LMG 10337 / NBRC 100064 / NCIMB 13643) TaxID=762903 RepID=F0S6I5_PSESL|nr:DUF5703 domain-containing protein [Pseudopedobacter saltans]ADY51061.1 hypothetical protein Pedsa_0479 [Pseudopedobacter saltans DSM 12145]
MFKLLYSFLLFVSVALLPQMSLSQNVQQYNPVWITQSKNSGESMPTGGGDIGLNVWVENGDILFYISKTGTFDENNTLLKLGRVRIRLNPNPFVNGDFKQELHLDKGYIKINGGTKSLNADVIIRTSVFHPLINVKVKSNQNIHAQAFYENWRYRDLIPKGKENNANSWKWAPQGDVRTHKDSITFDKSAIVFFHRNKDFTVFDAVVKQQGLEDIKSQLDNPIKNLTFGGIMEADNMQSGNISTGKYQNTTFRSWELKSIKATKEFQINIQLHTQQTSSISTWKQSLFNNLSNAKKDKLTFQKTENWWANYWKRSYIHIGKPKDEDWKISKNYQLFRYMLGCNAYGQLPTKFNGGLFTYDPYHVDTTLSFTPDFRNWGGGTHTAQNQRLVYWPMLKSGDFDMMPAQFNFYLKAQKNAELRTQHYWKHKGASFTEQIENFGLPNPAEYGWKRPENYDKGMEYNAWLEYQWDTAFEFCMMMLEQERYAGKDITAYIPLIESCLTFFDEHYQYLAKQRGRKALDENNHLVLYPGSSAETYKMAYNASSTVAALHSILKRLIRLPEQYVSSEQKSRWSAMLERIPALSYREVDGKTMISPAKLWERINNTETPQLYPVYPWGIFGINRPGLDTAINTYKFDKDALKFRSHIGWKQDNIFAARLGLTEEAWRLTYAKLNDSGRRFPAFWGPGFDWVPDHNWGGSGMIGLQEMLLQENGDQLLLFPAWPKDKDVSFKLHAPKQTIVEASWKNGKLEKLNIIPESRKKDVIVLLE